jgi:PAS domain S-box-containing protein
MDGEDPKFIELAVALDSVRAALAHALVEKSDLEARLSLVEARYAGLVDQADDFIYTHDLDFRLTSVNRAWERLSGYSAAECIGKKTLEFMSADSVPVAVDKLGEKLQRPSSTRYEVDMIAKDGSHVPFEVSSHPLVVAGRVVGVQGTARDIREWRRMEAEIADRARTATFGVELGRTLTADRTLEAALGDCAVLLCSHFGFLGAGFWTVDGAGLVMQGSAGPAASRLGGFGTMPFGSHRIGGVVRKREPLFIDIADAAGRTTGELNLAAGSGGVEVAAYPLVAADQGVGLMAVLSADLLTASVRDALASAASQVALHVDRAQAREALEASLSRYRGLFDHAPVGIYITSRQGRFIDANPTLLRMLACESLEALQAVNIDGRWRQEDTTRAELRVRLERDGELRGVKGTWRRLDGSEFQASENIRVIKSASGAILHFEGTVEEVAG